MSVFASFCEKKGFLFFFKKVAGASSGSCDGGQGGERAA
jgi:hypothetical protein